VKPNDSTTGQSVDSDDRKSSKGDAGSDVKLTVNNDTGSEHGSLALEQKYHFSLAGSIVS